MKATLGESRSSFATSRVALRLLGQRHCGGQLRPVAALAAFRLDKFCDLFAMVAYEIAPHGLALRLDGKSARLSITRGRKDRYHRW
jgi:hypothetical protein